MYFMGYPESSHPYTQWNKNLIGSDCTINLVEEQPEDVIYEKDPTSDVDFELYLRMSSDPIEPGSTIQTFTDYEVLAPDHEGLGKFELYVNDKLISQDISGLTLYNDDIVDGKAVIKVMRRQFIDYQLDPNTNTETKLFKEAMMGMWLLVLEGSEIYPTGVYKITTQDDANIYVNDILVAENSKQVILDLDEHEDLIEGKEHFIVKAIAESPTPTKQHIYEKGEDSDVKFNLFRMGQQVEEGTDLVPGSDYLVASQMMGVDIYVNENLIKSEASSLYTFTLTEDMSVDNHVVITVKVH